MPETGPQGFFAKNKKLLLLGCLGSTLCCCGFGGVLVGVINGAMKSSWAYTEALAVATSDSQVQAELGAPVTAGWLLMGSVNSTNGRGSASLTIPLVGQKATGKLYSEAHSDSSGKWQFDSLAVVVEGGKRIELRGE